jgi:DNA modification methylase
MQDRWPADRVERRKVADLIPYARNARTHSDEQVAQIAASIREWGWTTPVLIDEAGGIIAGHGRVMAARKLGLTDVPVMVAAGWSEAQKRAYVLADNKLALNAGWNDELLALELGEIGALGFDLGLTGFGTDEISALSATGTAGLTDPDAVPEPPVDPVTKPGDLWLLGEHRLLCGDSTKSEDVERLMAGAKADMMVTDPPYGVEYDADWRNQAKRPDGTTYGASALGKVSNDDRADWRESWALFPGEIAYVWHAGCRSPEVAESLTVCDFVIRNLIVWAKNSMVIGRGDYHHQHEPCWYVVRKGCPGRRTDDRTQTTLWQIDKPQKSETGHSTQKPVECMARPMRNHEAELIYDPFLGSGTTLIAAEQLGRKCYGMEISPQYCDVIVKRWQDFTGKKARHADTNMTFEEHRDGQAVLRTD